MNIVSFYHIPKTGGQSFRRFLRSVYNDKKEIKTIIPEGIEINKPNGIYLGKDGKWNCAFGHSACFSCFWSADEYTYIAFARNPINRIISHYFQNKYIMANHNLIYFDRSFNDIFEDNNFWENERYNYSNSYINYTMWFPWTSNFLCRAFSRYTCLINSEMSKWTGNYTRDLHIISTGPSPSYKMFQECVDNISNGSITIEHPFTWQHKTNHKVKKCKLIVLITEQMDRSIQLISKIMGWRKTKDKYWTAKTNLSGNEKISERAIENIKRYNAFDLDIYNLAKHRFERMCKEYGV